MDKVYQLNSNGEVVSNYEIELLKTRSKSKLTRVEDVSTAIASMWRKVPTVSSIQDKDRVG